MNNLTINELVQLLKSGDMRAFDRIYRLYSRRLYVFVLKFIKQEEEAEGIVQEVFIRVWESRKRIDLHRSFESFLFTIAYNTTISLLRKKVAEQKFLEQLKMRRQISDAEKIISEIHYRELNEKLDKVLEELTLRQQEIYRLCRQEGLTHKEIAEKLQLSVSTVKNHLVTTLQIIRLRFKDEWIAGCLFIGLFI